MRRRDAILLLLGGLVMTGSQGCAAPPPSHWPTASAAESGFKASLGESLDAAYAAGELEGLHAVVLVRHGKLVLERYYRGEDETWGRSIGMVTFDPEVKHDLRSVSKSVVSLLYGIALAEGKVPPLDAPVIAQFPQYPDLAANRARRQITVEHLLTMTTGLEWNEDLPYTDKRNSEVAMEYAADRYRFVLEQPIVEPPGRNWDYNGGATALLGKLIADGTGQDLVDFAEARLFAPLEIADFHWSRGYDREPAAASGLRLRPRDLAKIGQLVLNEGRWGGKQVVPADWLRASHTPKVRAFEELSYGYQWWLGVGKSGKPWQAGFGNGGQRIWIYPHLDVVLVVMAGNYNQPDAWKMPLSVLLDHIAPAIER